MKFEILATSADSPLKLAGTLDIYAADALRAALSQQLEQRRALSLDLSAVEACDAIALQLLCSARNSAWLAGKPFSVTAASAAVTQSCDALGFTAEQCFASQSD